MTVPSTPATRSLEALRAKLAAPTGEPAPFPADLDPASLSDDFLVCHCTNVTAGEIREVIRDGASDLDEVQRCTRAGGGCGKCVPLLGKLVSIEISGVRAS